MPFVISIHVSYICWLKLLDRSFSCRSSTCQRRQLKRKRWSTRGGLLRNIVGKSACSKTISWTSSPGMIRYCSCLHFSLGEREMGGKGKSMMCEHVCFSCLVFLINIGNSISILYFFPFGVLFGCVVTQKFSDKVRHSYWLMWLCTWDMSLTCSLYIWPFETSLG